MAEIPTDPAGSDQAQVGPGEELLPCVRKTPESSAYETGPKQAIGGELQEFAETVAVPESDVMSSGGQDQGAESGGRLCLPGVQ
jgi:hypothetical protein